MLVRVDGQILDVGDLSDLEDDRLIELAVAMQEEIKRRIGRCDLCGRRHNSFRLCPAGDPMVREQESDFEVALRRRMGS